MRKIRALFVESPRTAILSILFIGTFLALLVLLLIQVDSAYDVTRQVNPEIAKIPGLGAVPVKNAREVLILNSYHVGYSWSDNEMAGIVTALREADPKILPLVEYLDCKHYPRMEHFNRLRDLFLRKYGSRRFPVVIAADNPALAFALRYRQQLFPRSAVVFCGINGYHPAMLEGHKNVTGVAELLDARGTLELALRLHPAANQVFVVHDYSITGLSTRRETELQLAAYAGRIPIRYLENMATMELADFLRTVSPDNLVLALSYSLDSDGNVINHEKISRLLSENSPAPVYGLHEERLGYGIVGGSLMGGEMQGKRAAQLALRVLRGEQVSAIPVDITAPALPMFDYDQLIRFRIPVDALPAGAIIVNQPISFFADHPGLVVTTMGIIAILLTGIAVLGMNIYQRQHAEREQRRLQDQLIHAQKMEAVGHLAGGVAHDFNNILTAIIGYTNLVRKNLPEGDPSRSFTDQILTASERAAKLVRSLLTFSRKQKIEAKPTNLNEIVIGTERIARRLIGEDIDFTIILRSGETAVMADSGQIEQVLLNLCTNARDAMPQGGRLTIETDRVQVDPSSLARHQLERPGVYGLISVSDTGTGMDESVRRQVFEPFFTTKEVGKGTGLGLSIAYGIIKQHRGIISLYSEPGSGTTFKIYLPAHTAPARPLPARTDGRAPGGRELVLVAEDDVEVRNMVSIILRDAGYAVIEAVDGEDAVERFCENRAAVRLLLMDVIMPKKNGREAYEVIRGLMPEVRVLFMSGYTADMVKSKGIIDNGTLFLAKPVKPDDLLRKVRQVLDAQVRQTETA